MRLVCLPPELYGFWSAKLWSGAGVSTAVWGFDCIAASGCIGESPSLPDCQVCCSYADSHGSFGTAVWSQASVGDRRRYRTPAAFPMVGTGSPLTGLEEKDYIGGIPILLSSLGQ